MTILPSLEVVQDESGNDLLYLGLVTDKGFVRSDGMTVGRIKGRSAETDITGLFQWSGDVCYLTPVDTSVTKQICVIDNNADGIWDEGVPPALVEPYCPTGYTLLTAYCQAYKEDWIFNIADFVEYLWTISNDGSKLVQVRFYPN